MPEEIEIDPQSLRKMLDTKQSFFFLDCREPQEHEVARIDGGDADSHERASASGRRNPEGPPVVVYCHHGMRSMNVALWLRSKSVDAQSLAGGIDRWSAEIDPNVPRY